MGFDLEKLKELYAEVYNETGPWEVGGPWPSVTIIFCVSAGCDGIQSAGEPPWYEPVVTVHQSVDYVTPPSEFNVHVAELIVRMFNLLPQLMKGYKP